jgi:transcriptional regulator with XRE-family HTH domain
MRTGFGRYALELRVKRGISLSKFSEIVSLSPQRVCNIEFGRAPVSDDVVGSYIQALNLNGTEAHELRVKANFSNGLKRSSEEQHQHPPLRAFFDLFANQLSPKGAAEIQKILERESGLSIKSLAFASNQMAGRNPRVRRHGTRPLPLPKRFAEICLLAEEKRNLVAEEMSPVKMGLAVERLAASEKFLDFQVVDELPSIMGGAFACILGEKAGHTITIEARRFLSADKGVHFARHVIAHEIAHHYLHPQLLESEGEVYLSPQSLSRNTPEMIGTDRQVEQVVENIIESEAEIFATMFLVPWTAYLKGTGLNYLAWDYGEQLDEVKRYAPHFKNRAVIDAFKGALWSRGTRIHAVFNID